MILQAESHWPRARRGIAAMAGGLAFLAVVAPALAAPSADDVGKALAAAVAATGQATLTYSGAAASGDTVTLSDVKIVEVAPSAAPAPAPTKAAAETTTPAAPSAPPAQSAVTIPALVLSGVAERSGGGFTATHLEFDNGTTTARHEQMTWTTAGLDTVVVPSAAEVTARAKIRPFAAFSAAGITISGRRFATPVTLASVSGSIGDITAAAPAAIHWEAHGLKLSPALLANSYVGAFITMLNYDSVTADMVFDGAWDTNADNVTLTSFSIGAPDMGRITVSGKVSDLSMRGIADPAKAKDARAAAKLEQVSLRLDNSGFVEHMLDMQAQMLGGTRDDVRAQITTAALPFFLGFVKNAAFRDEAEKAFTAFLADPRSLTITAAAPQPVPLSEAMRAALHAPGTIPDLLGLSVTANN
ncbi:MAG TPA: hypothetical protein VHA70_05575 [Bauldia sp.]|nr:hypothetical protein [Bauldia sp.]HVZ15283.1 hypothetical protein [Bauldia sp.]